MSILKFEGKSIFYDVQGQGKPIIILNGIMMSTKSWEPFVNSFIENNQLIRLDFLDQGQSDKCETIVTHKALKSKLSEHCLRN